MPVKKTTKKTVSKKERAEIRQAAQSIPGLIIEHLSFEENTPREKGDGNANKKYMLSKEKEREHKKKKNTMFFGVGVVIVVLCSLWVLNIKSFFFDSKHSVSTEEALISAIKNDFNNTVGLLSSERPESIASSTLNAVRKEELKAALIAGLETTTNTSSTLLTSSTEDVHFPTAQDVTTTTSTKPTP